MTSLLRNQTTMYYAWRFTRLCHSQARAAKGSLRQDNQKSRSFSFFLSSWHAYLCVVRWYVGLFDANDLLAVDHSRHLQHHVANTWSTDTANRTQNVISTQRSVPGTRTLKKKIAQSLLQNWPHLVWVEGCQLTVQSETVKYEKC